MSTAGWMFSVKTFLLSTATLSAAVMAKVFVPSMLNFASSGIPRLYSSLLSWLAPPYLYFVVNCIIITIAAASRFQEAPSNVPDHSRLPSLHVVAPMVYGEVKLAPVVEPREVLDVVMEPVVEVAEVGKSVVVNKLKVEKKGKSVESKMEGKEEEEEEEFVISRSNWTPANRRCSDEFYAEEKPPTSSRFGSRKSVKASPEGKSLRVARQKRNETMESTWKLITDGRAMPLTRHLKKSDTSETQGKLRRDPFSPMKKSQTFNERRTAVTSSSPSPGSSGGARLRKEPSLSQDELNRRVEAFINKFNQEMRLQRLESHNKYLSMLNREEVDNKNVP